MTPRPAPACLVLSALVCAGCSGVSRPQPAEPLAGTWTPAQVTHVQFQVDPLGPVPNNGLQLPVLSPDGKWIAFLDRRSDLAPDLDSLFTGRGLQEMSLHVRPVGDASASRELCQGGAAWPAWSPDGSRLAYVWYDPAGACTLCLHDLASGKTRRLAIGLTTMAMPALSPSGRQLAVVGTGSAGGPLRLHVVDLETGRVARTCPVQDPQEQQLWPQWTPDGSILYIRTTESAGRLARWGPGQYPPESLADVNVRPTRVGLYQALAALGAPLSPDGTKFAYYDALRDGIDILNLAGAKCIELPSGTRAGCWLDAEAFAAASDDELRLFDVSADQSAARLARGAWLPRGALPGAGELILCAKGANKGMLELARVTILGRP